MPVVTAAEWHTAAMLFWPDIIGKLPWAEGWAAKIVWTGLGLLLLILANFVRNRLEAKHRLNLGNGRR